jgi:hypothetical protein
MVIRRPRRVESQMFAADIVAMSVGGGAGLAGLCPEMPVPARPLSQLHDPDLGQGAVPVHAVGLLLLWRRRDLMTPPHVAGVVSVLALYLMSILCATNIAFLLRRTNGLIQLTYSITICYALFLTVAQGTRRQIGRLFLGFSLVILIGCLLETHAGLRPVSDAVRNVLYSKGVYENDLRDVLFYHQARPKFFASEPASVTFCYTLFTFIWMVVSEWRWKMSAAGAGLSGEPFIESEVTNLYVRSTGSAGWQVVSPATELLINYFWLHWIYLGIVWGLLIIAALTAWLRVLGVPSPAFCWVAWAILGQASGAYVGPTCWALLFLAGGAAVLYQRSEQREAKYRAASATTPYGLSLRRRILRLRSMRQAPHFRENIRSGRASD